MKSMSLKWKNRQPSGLDRPTQIQPVAFVSQSITNIDRFSIVRDFIGLVGVEVEFAETEEAIRGYLRSNLGSVCWR